MTAQETVLTRAAASDLDGNLALQAAKQIDQGGSLSAGEEERAKGLAQMMFVELRRLQPGREGVLLIRKDNEPSLNAHLKMGMKEVAAYSFNGFEYVVFSHIG